MSREKNIISGNTLKNNKFNKKITKFDKIFIFPMKLKLPVFTKKENERICKL
jgi:hypothetical protein